MYFETFAAAVQMDGHGAFVWPAYLIAMVAIALILILPGMKKRKFLAQLAGQIRREQVHAESSEGDE